MLPVVAQNVANILAKETLDAFPEFLHSIDVFLRHSPGPIRGVGRARLESLDFLFHQEIPRNVRDQILHQRECFYRLDRDRFVERQVAQTGHAHEFRHSVHFRGTGTAFPGLAIPSTSQVVRLFRLNIVHGIEHNHALGYVGRVIVKLSAVCIAAPNLESRGGHR